MNRQAARRRKGSHRQGWKADPTPITSPEAAAALRYWHTAYGQINLVYFLQEENDGPIKIGWAYDPVKRAAELQCGNPRKLIIKALVLGGAHEEKQIQAVWRQKASLRGEWFGKGHQQAILNHGLFISDQQIDAHREGAWHDDLTRGVFLKALFTPQEEAA